MDCRTFRLFPAACLGLHLTAGYAAAEPEADAAAEAEVEVISDEDFAKSLAGTTYSGSLDIEGWTSAGGGLVSPPIYVNQYQREDGTILVLTTKEGADGSDEFEVADALIVDAPKKGWQFSTACTKGDDYALRYLAEVSGRDANEWWTNVRKAWEIELETGKISDTKTRGVKCTNPDW